MLQLEEEHQTYLIERLACFARPSIVAQELKDLYGLEVSLPRLNYYDPTKAQGKRELAVKWKELFFTTRKAFLDDPDAAPARHKQYRLLRLYEIVETAKGAATQMKALEQIAKEEGGQFTNKSLVEQTNNLPAPAVYDMSKLSREELDTVEKILAKAALTNGDTGGTGKT